MMSRDQCFGVLLGLAAIVPHSLMATAETPSLFSRWGKEIAADDVLSEHPRPQRQRDGWQNLNGRWEYAIRNQDSPLPESFDGDILVPFPVESMLSGVLLLTSATPTAAVHGDPSSGKTPTRAPGQSNVASLCSSSRPVGSAEAEEISTARLIATVVVTRIRA